MKQSLSQIAEGSDESLAAAVDLVEPEDADQALTSPRSSFRCSLWTWGSCMYL